MFGSHSATQLTPAHGGAAELRLLGVPALRVAQRHIALSAKDAALLALAALSGPIRADRVAALLWPQAAAKQADTSLRQRLYRLRQETGLPLLSSGALLQLSAELGTDLAPTLERIGHDAHAGSDELLGDIDYEDLPDLAEWVRGQRQHWREQRDAALAAALAQCEKEGAVVRGLAYAHRLIDADPLAEHAQRCLMRLHYLRGDGVAAIAALNASNNASKTNSARGHRPKRSSCWRPSSVAPRHCRRGVRLRRPACCARPG